MADARGLLSGVFVFFLAAVPVGAQEPPAVETFLLEGRLSDGIDSFRRTVEENPEDQTARFSLGILQFLQTVEGLGQDQYRYGLLAGRARAMPFMRLPIPENPAPEKLSYAAARQILVDLQQQLLQAEATLAEIEPAGIKLPLRILQARLDLNGDGTASESESVAAVLQALQPRRQNQAVSGLADLVVAFDDADAVWLRGYCHLLLAMSDMVLAYDWQDQFERTAHLFYPNVESPYEFLQLEGTGQIMGFNGQNVLDLIAWFHTINYDLVEPERMPSALEHLETVIVLSRKNWSLIQSETDDDREWVPSARQTTILPGLAVTQQVITGWQQFLDELEAILAGKKLVPFWRGIRGGFGPLTREFPRNPHVGLNVRKMFTEPTRFDLALWLQGTALVPYLESGEIIEPEEWQQLMSAFGGNFFNFALWFN